MPLREERAFVDNYLSLERLRLGDRLRVTIDLPAETLDDLVPAFSIQILVENAIRHAIAPRAAGGTIEIRARDVGGRLRVSVRDAGAGESGDLPNGGSGIGLRLLQERLDALYGSDAKLTLQSTDGGTCADLEIPARCAAKDEQ